MLSTKSFYSGSVHKKNIRLLVTLLRKEKELKKRAVVLPFRPRLDLLSDDCWEVFYSQKDAIDFSRSSQGLHVFAFESESFFENTGQRMYLVSTYPQFWHYYSQLIPSQRHYYEVIPEDSACHLYFDLEFERSLNEGRDGEGMVHTFIIHICKWLSIVFGVECNSKHVLILDASTEQKFSQHLIYHLPDSAFKNNFQAGLFVKHVCREMLADLARRSSADSNLNINEANSDRGSSRRKDSPSNIQDSSNSSDNINNDDLSNMLIMNKSGKKDLFCDLGVYSKNRNFRLYLSSKRGKSNPLVVARNNEFSLEEWCSRPRKRKTVKVDSMEETLLASLISNIQPSDDVTLLQFEPEVVKEKRPRMDWSSESIQDTALLSGSSNCRQAKSSCFKAVDDFVRSIINIGGIQGEIWRCSYFSQTELLFYDIIKNRWCENIGRQHKSNNIIIVVNLKKRSFHQKCHDMECKAANFRSPDFQFNFSVSFRDRTIPSCVFDRLRSEQGVTIEEGLSDEDLVRAVERVEQDGTFELEVGDVITNDVIITDNVIPDVTNFVTDDGITDEELVIAVDTL